jgi:hypothetical protein
MGRGACGLAAALCALALGSCGGKLPEVVAVEWRLESRPGEGGLRYESLTAFGSIKDEDGLDNIEEIWVVNDASAFAWKLTSADWSKSPEGIDNWIGGSSLATPELGPLPRGDYRFVAIDAAGQRAERAFSVTGDFPSKAAPSVSYSAGAGRLSVRSEWAETLLLSFDAAGVLLRSATAPKKEATLAELLGADIAERTALLCAYGFEPNLKIGSFSPRIRTR